MLYVRDDKQFEEATDWRINHRMLVIGQRFKPRRMFRRTSFGAIKHHHH
jgi:hypothetical protein